MGISIFFEGAVIDDDTGQALEYQDLIKNEKYRDTWSTSLANELGRLAKGIRDIKGTNTIYFTLKSDIPQDRIKDITYGKIVVAYKPHKADPNRTRLTVGGDRITCLYDVSTPTSDLPTIKNVMEFRPIYPRSQMFHTRHLKLLPRNTNGQTRVHENTIQNNPAGNHRQIQTE